VISVIHPDNHASKRVVQKLGFQLESHREYPPLPGVQVEIWAGDLR